MRSQELQGKMAQLESIERFQLTYFISYLLRAKSGHIFTVNSIVCLRHN